MSDIAHTRLEFKSLENSDSTVGVLTLNRPQQANAFSMQMMDEITFHMGTVSKRKDCRVLLIVGAGKHFSGGADLGWMQSSAKLSYNENVKDSHRLSVMFEAVANIEIPTVAVVKGAVFGGGVGLVAACDFAIAHKDAKFCLSEARLGLLPAVIAPYLCRKIPTGQLRRLALSAKNFSAAEALTFGLIEVVAENDLEVVVRQELQQLLNCSSDAQRSIKVLFDRLRLETNSQIDATVSAIAKARTGSDGQAGVEAFFAKQPAPWTAAVPDSFSIFESQN